ILHHARSDRLVGRQAHRIWSSEVGPGRRQCREARRHAQFGHDRRSLGTALPGMTREEAWSIVCEFVQTESLRRHMLGVEACLTAYADKFAQDRELWAVT